MRPTDENAPLHSPSDTSFAEQLVAKMSTRLNDNRHLTPHVPAPKRSMWRWLLYYGGLCLELLGMAYMGAVIVMFFGQVEARELLSLTARGMVLFYGGWFCVRQASRGAAKASQERGRAECV